MAQSIDKHLIIQFSDMVHEQAQQIRARLRPWADIRPMSGDLWAFDGLGDVEAQEVVGRVQKVEFQDIDHLRRKLSRRRFIVTLPIDENDVEGMLLDPQAMYAKAVVKAMERRFDRVLIEAAFADVKTGRDFETTVTAAADGVITVNATAGLTFAKVLEINENFLDNEVGNDIEEEMMLTITGKEHTSLLNESQLTSGDFTRQFAIEKGSMVNAVGLDLIKYGGSVTNPLLNVTSGTRDLIAMTKGALFVGVTKEFEMKIQERSDLIQVTQVQIIGTLGAVRKEGILIQKVQTTA